MNTRNRYLFELYLHNKMQPYEVNKEAISNKELYSFVKHLFELTDEFYNTRNTTEEDKIEHLEKVLHYAENELGRNSKFVEHIEIELKNQTRDDLRDTSYSDYILRLRAIYNLYGE